MDDTTNVTGEELRQFVEQIESLNSEVKAASNLVKEKYAEVKARGYDAKAVRKIINLRKKPADAVAEEDAILDMYKQALGME